MLKSKKLHSYLGIAVSLGLIGWIATILDWDQLGQEFAKVSLWPLIPLTLAVIVQLALRAARWRYLLPESKDLKYSALFDSLMIGNMATFLLPLRAGEFIRPLVLVRDGRYTFATAFASVIVERFFDLSAVLLTFGLLALSLPSLPPLAVDGALALSVIAVGILLFICIGIWWPQVARTITRRGVALLPARMREPIIRFNENLLQAVAVLRSMRNLVMVLLYTTAVWISTYVGFAFGLWMFGMPADLLIGTTIGVIVALAVAAPSAPGFIGVFQTGCIAALALFGISQEFAVAYSVVLHAQQFILVVLLGALCLARQGLSFSSLNRGTPVASVPL